MVSINVKDSVHVNPIDETAIKQHFLHIISTTNSLWNLCLTENT